MWLYHRVMNPNDADRIANSVDPDPSVRKLRIIYGTTLRQLLYDIKVPIEFKQGFFTKCIAYNYSKYIGDIRWAAVLFVW